MTTHQIGLMLLRVWVEEGSTKPLRVDVHQTHDVSSGFPDVLTLTDVDKVLESVRTFLEDVRPDSPPTSTDGEGARHGLDS